MNIFVIACTLICISFINSTDKSIQRSLKRAKPAEHLYTYSHALNKIGCERSLGLTLLNQADEENEKKEKEKLLNNAAECFKIGTYGLPYFWYDTNAKSFAKNLLVDPTSADNCVHTHYRKILEMNDVSEKTIHMFAQPIPFLFNGLALQHFTLDTTQDDLDNMTLNVFVKTGSTGLLNYLWQSPLLLDKEVILQAVWKGAKKWKPHVFAQNMQILLQSAQFLTHHESIFNNPLFKADFYLTCIKQNFNPFTLEQDAQAYDVLKDLLKSEIHRSFPTSFDETSINLTQKLLADLRIFPLQRALENSDYGTFAHALEPYFLLKSKLGKIDSLNIFPLLKNHFTQNKFDPELFNIGSLTIDPALLKTYATLGAMEGKEQLPALIALYTLPSAISLAHAFEENFQKKNWNNFSILIPACIKYLKDEWSFNTITKHGNLFTKYLENEEFNRNVDPILIHMFHTNFNTLYVHRALHEKKVPADQLMDCHLEAARHSEEWLNGFFQSKFALTNQFPNNTAAVEFDENNFLLGLVNKSTELLTKHGASIIMALTEDINILQRWEACIYHNCAHVEKNYPIEFSQYLKHMPELSLNGYSAVMATLISLYNIAQKYPSQQTEPSAIFCLLTELSKLPVEQRTILTQDMLYAHVKQAYELTVNRDLLCIIKDNAPAIVDLATATGQFMRKIKKLSSQEIFQNLNFLQDSGIINHLQKYSEDPYVNILLTDIQAVRCMHHLAQFESGEYRETQAAHLQEFSALVYKLQSFKFEDEIPGTPELKLLDLEQILKTQQLIWEMEFDHAAAVDSLYSMLEHALFDITDTTQHKINTLCALQAFKKKNKSLYEAFITKITAASADSTSREIRKLRLVSAYLHALTNKKASGFDTLLNVLQEYNCNPLFAEALLHNVESRKASLTHKNNLITILEPYIYLCRGAFHTWERCQQEQFLHLLNNVRTTCFCPHIEILLYELQVPLVKNAMGILEPNPNAPEYWSTRLPKPDEALHRLINQFQMQLTTKGSFTKLHAELDEYLKCQFFERGRKCVEAELLTSYDLLYGHFLYLATRSGYSKFIEKNSKYESLLSQIAEAHCIISTELENDLKREKPEISNNIYGYILNALKGLELGLYMEYEPEKATQHLNTALKKILNIPVQFTYTDDLLAATQECFNNKALHKYVEYLVKKGNLTDDELTVGCYVSSKLAFLEDDASLKKEFAEQCIKFADQIKIMNHIILGEKNAVYRGEVCPAMRNEKKSNETYQETLEHFSKRFAEYYYNGPMWKVIINAVKAANKKDDGSMFALALAKIYFEKKKYAEALEFAREARRIENIYKTKQSPFHESWIGEKSKEYMRIRNQ